MKKPPKRRPGKKRRQPKAVAATARAPAAKPAVITAAVQVTAARTPVPARSPLVMRPPVRAPATFTRTLRDALVHNRQRWSDAGRLAVPFAAIMGLLTLQWVWQAPPLLWDRGAATKPADVPLVAARRLDDPEWPAPLASFAATAKVALPVGPMMGAATKAPWPLYPAAAPIKAALTPGTIAARQTVDDVPARTAVALAAGDFEPLQTVVAHDAPIALAAEVLVALVELPSVAVAEAAADFSEPAQVATVETSVHLAGATPALMTIKTMLTAEAERGICTADQSPALRPARASLAHPTGEAFGHALADAATAQTAELVIYNETYRAIAYPGGDVAPLYGVCTDVVIRAFRALGIDLQTLVRQSGAGTGDPSIDHRRTDILRRFFERAGAALPITEFADQYKPGDIITYLRPQNYGVPSHIAIVTGIVGPSGRPMIVHNRGSGIQIEDALFVNQITGHFRFDGELAGRVLAGQIDRPVRTTVAAKRRILAKRSLRAIAGMKTAEPAARIRF